MWGDVGPRSPPSRPPPTTNPSPSWPIPSISLGRRIASVSALQRGRHAARGLWGRRRAYRSPGVCRGLRACVCVWEISMGFRVGTRAASALAGGSRGGARHAGGGSWHSRDAFDSPSLRRLGQHRAWILALKGPASEWPQPLWGKPRRRRSEGTQRDLHDAVGRGSISGMCERAQYDPPTLVGKPRCLCAWK